MGYLLGTDEAGYGPNLGPLLIGATLWQVPDDQLNVDLYDTLSAAVTSTPRDRKRLCIADSKRIYKPKGTLSRLEQGVLAGLSSLGKQPRTWPSLWDALDQQAAVEQQELPWYQTHKCEIPRAADLADISKHAERLVALQSKAKLVDMRARAVFPPLFNDLVERYDSKGAALSLTTLRLIRSQLETLEPAPVRMMCDKHGGRNRYLALLQDIFPDQQIRIVEESRQISTYRWGSAETGVVISFQAKGEGFLPAALASMICKYLREISMEAFNQFWCSRVDDLHPTAGYPVDAKRYRQEIDAERQRLGIDNRLLWRSR